MRTFLLDYFIFFNYLKILQMNIVWKQRHIFKFQGFKKIILGTLMLRYIR